MYMPFLGHLWMLLGLLAFLLFWGGVAVLVIWAVRTFSSRAAEHPVGAVVPSPRQILDERLVRGEIKVEEYEKIKAVLERV